MYRNRLLFALSVLVALCIVQAVVAVWSSNVAREHMQRSQVANQLLSEFITLGADKQRLKVWLAQYLLTTDQATDERDRLLQQMQRSLIVLDELLARDQQLAVNQQDITDIREQVRILSILEVNVATLAQSLQQEPAANGNEAQTWTLLIETFDRLEGLDLRRLIAQAIERQRTRSEQAETAAVDAIARARLIVAGLALIGSLLACVFAYILLKGLYAPLSRLLEGTSALVAGNFKYRVAAIDDKEFRDLASSFNDMAATIDAANMREARHRQEIELEVAQRTAQLQHAMENLRQAEVRQKQFLADISHELRTPATSIQGEAEIALRGTDKQASEYQFSLRQIVAASKDLAKRIDELLMLIRDDQKLGQVTLTPMQAPELVQALVDQAQSFATVSQRNIEVACDLADADACDVAVELDKLLQAWQIILDNAVKYSPPNSLIRVLIDVASEMNTTYVNVSVTDRGIGIKSDDIGRVTERNFRAQNARQARPDGLGIGLALAQTIVSQHQARLRIESQVNQGTCVTLQLPTLRSSVDA